MGLLKLIGKIFAGGYTFPDGSRLMGDGRDAELYIDPRGRRVSVQCELWDSASGIERCIYASSITRWLPPYDMEEIAENERQEIIEKISTLYRKTKTTFVVK